MHRKLLQRIITNRFALLLIALILLLCIVPLMDGRSRLARLLHLISLTLVFIAGVVANRSRPRVYYAGIIATLVALPVLWSSLGREDGAVSTAGIVIVAAYCLVMAGLILISVFRDEVEAQDGVMGAIAAYLLIGMAWAFLYVAVVRETGPNTIAIQDNTADRPRALTTRSPFVDFVYFSFVTMSTLGYGDFSPISPLARTFAWVQSVAGQFYLAALVARLISVIPRRNSEAPMESG